MKKILLNIMTFILVVAGTAICVVYARTDRFTNTGGQVSTPIIDQTDQTSTPKPSEPEDKDDPEEDENSLAFFGIISELLGLENFSSDISIKSSDGKTDVLGTIKVKNSQPATTIEDFDISKISLSLSLYGKVENIPFNANVLLIDEEVFVTVNNVRVTTNTENLTNIINLVMEAVGVSVESDFDIESLAPYLETMLIDKMSDGYQLSIELPVVNKVVVLTDDNYALKNVVIDSITAGNKSFSINLGNTSSKAVNLTTPDKTRFIDLNDSYGLVALIVNTAKNLPLRMEGNISFMGKTGEMSFSITSDFEISFNMTYNNIDIYAHSSGNNVYLYVMGIKVLTTWPEIIDFVANNLEFSIPDNLGIKKISASGINFDSDASVVIRESEGRISEIVADISGVLIELKRTIFLSVSNKPDTTGSLSMQDIEKAYKDFAPLFDELEQFSFDIDSSFGTTTLKAKAYLSMTDKFAVRNLYVEGSLNSKPLNIYMTDSKIYINYNGTKISSDKDHLGDYASVIKSVVNADIFAIEEVIELLSTEVKNLSLSPQNVFAINFINKSQLSISKVSLGYKIYLLGLVINKTTLNASVSISENPSKYQSLGNNIVDEEYTPIENVSSFADSAINTFKETNTFEGNLSISLFGITIKNISINIDTSYKSNKLKVVIKLNNLPANALFTEINAIKYKNQSATITYEDGKIHIYRTAKYRFSSGSRELVNKTINASDFSTDDISVIFGFDSTISKKISGVTTPSNPADLVLLDTLSVLDSQMSITLATSTFMKRLSDSNLTIETNDGYISKIAMSLKFSKVIGISLTLEKK